MEERVNQNDKRAHEPMVKKITLNLNSKYRAYLKALDDSTKDINSKALANTAQSKYVIYQKKYKELKNINLT